MMRFPWYNILTWQLNNLKQPITDRMNKMAIHVAIVLLLGACKPATEITGSWKNTRPSVAAENISTILVTALTDSVIIRQTMENKIALVLQNKGYNTIKSIDVVPPTFRDGKQPNKDELIAKINETGAQAILTVAIIDKETETRYVPGNYNYAPVPRFNYYGTFWRYYSTWVPTLYSPGYYAQDKVYFIETNLYDAKTEELLWSAQSESYNPSRLADFSEDVARVIVSRMEKDGLLKMNNSTELAKQRDNK
jgi:hypothetical protein